MESIESVEKTSQNDKESKNKPHAFRYYQNGYPAVGDLVVFKFGKMEEEKLVRVTLPEYLNKDACILLKELTRSKRVRSYQRLCPTGQLGVGEVLSTENDGEYIFLSVKTITKEDKDQYMEWYSKSKRLLSFMRKISRGTQKDIMTLCSEISWPLYNLQRKQVGLDAGDSANSNGGSGDGSGEGNPKYRHHPLDMIDNLKKLQNLRSIESSLSSVAESPETANVTTSTISKENLQLLGEWQESFFGKPVYDEVFKFGLMSYGVEGSEEVRQVLMDIMNHLRDTYPEIKREIGLRDMPIYEIKLHGFQEEQLKKAVNEITTKLQNSGLMFRLLS